MFGVLRSVFPLLEPWIIKKACQEADAPWNPKFEIHALVVQSLRVVFGHYFVRVQTTTSVIKICIARIFRMHEEKEYMQQSQWTHLSLLLRGVIDITMERHRQRILAGAEKQPISQKMHAGQGSLPHDRSKAVRKQRAHFAAQAHGASNY